VKKLPVRRQSAEKRRGTDASQFLMVLSQGKLL
jgi:hypothetical protein